MTGLNEFDVVFYFSESVVDFNSSHVSFSVDGPGGASFSPVKPQIEPIEIRDQEGFSAPNSTCISCRFVINVNSIQLTYQAIGCVFYIRFDLDFVKYFSTNRIERFCA